MFAFVLCLGLLITGNLFLFWPGQWLMGRLYPNRLNCESWICMGEWCGDDRPVPKTHWITLSHVHVANYAQNQRLPRLKWNITWLVDIISEITYKKDQTNISYGIPTHLMQLMRSYTMIVQIFWHIIQKLYQCHKRERSDHVESTLLNQTHKHMTIIERWVTTPRWWRLLINSMSTSKPWMDYTHTTHIWIL